MTLPDSVELNGTLYEFDFRGYLQDFSRWSPQLMDWYAEREKIELTVEHRKVIDFLRIFFAEKKVHPVARSVAEEMGETLGREKGTVKYLHTLFPTGIHQAYKIAGLPRILLSV